MKDSLQPGLEGTVRHRVVSEHLVSYYNPDSPAVLSSPWMLFMMEHAAYETIKAHLDEGEESVGVGFAFEHLAATPAGHWVEGKARVTAAGEGLVSFEIEAYDQTELIGRGTHVRAVIQMDRFKKRLAKKREQ